jgi:hypothetical protein
MSKKYFFFYLEIALKGDDTHIYAFENVSHVPTSVLVEIFGIKLDKDPNILEGYFLTASRYKKYKKQIKEYFPPINLDVFEYCLGQYGADDFSDIRKLYKEDLME